MKYALLFASCLLLILIFGCSDDNPLENGSPAPFPNTVGSYWVYEAVDSIRGTTDTLTVTIVDTMTLSGMDQPATLWYGDTRNIYLAWGDDSTWVTLESYPDDKDTARYYFWREGWEPGSRKNRSCPIKKAGVGSF